MTTNQNANPVVHDAAQRGDPTGETPPLTGGREAWAVKPQFSNRRSINGPRPRHVNPIPNAARIGNLVMSSVISGIDGTSLELPEALEDQIANVYANIRSDVEAAGGSLDDIIKITFWLKDPLTQRVALNDGWIESFPDPEHRPARHTLTLPAESKGKVQADFVAVLS